MADNPLNEQQGPLPFGMMPSLGAGMFGGVPFPGGMPLSSSPTGVLPQPSPVQSAGGAQDWLSQAYQEALRSLERQRGLAGEAAKVREERTALEAQPPKRGYTPGWEHGEGAGGLFRNIARALAVGSQMTGPGQAAMGAIYGPGVREFESKRKGLSDRLAALLEQQKVEEAPILELGRGVGMLGRAQAGLTQAEVAVKNAETHAADIASQVRTRLETVAQGWERLNQQERLVALKEYLAPLEIAIKQQMAANPQAVAQIHAAAMLSATNVLAQSKVLSGTSILADVQAWGQGLLVPAAPQAPGGAAPVGAPTQMQGAAPPRPKNVPADAQWNPANRRWEK